MPPPRGAVWTLVACSAGIGKGRNSREGEVRTALRRRLRLRGSLMGKSLERALGESQLRILNCWGSLVKGGTEKPCPSND